MSEHLSCNLSGADGGEVFFRRRGGPLFGGVTTRADVLDRVLLPKWLLCPTGPDGQIVAQFQKPVNAPMRCLEATPVVEAAPR
jgi:hypothetical protein